MPSESVDQSFVLGLDGVPWNLLRRWTEDGDLPHLAQLMESGASGPLESTMPPTTAVAWPSIATGTRADKHGIYAFRQLNADYSRTINTSTTLKEPPVWEIVSPAIVGNVPMTYPATNIDGTMVTGMMTPSRDSHFTHPTSFSETIEQAIPDYQIGLAWHEYQGEEESFLADLEDMVTARRELMRLLMEREDWSLFFFVYTAPDRLQHLIWDEDIILEHYQMLDGIVGEVMEYVEDAGAALFVVSDHGFGPVNETVYLNSLFERAGYVKRQDSTGTRGVLDRVGLEKQSIQSLLSRMGIEKALLSVLPDSAVDNLARRIPGNHGMYDVDFTRTQAFSYSSRLVYINDQLRFDDGVVPPAARDGVKKEVAALLETALHPNSAEPLVNVWDGSELFPTDPKAPDLVVEAKADQEVHSTLSDDLLAPSGARAGGHRRTGIFLAWGPHIASTEIVGATVFDVLPTLLHDRQQAIPRDVDGTVLDIFEDKSTPATESPRITAYRRGTQPEEQAADFGEVENRLRGLGYLD